MCDLVIVCLRFTPEFSLSVFIHLFAKATGILFINSFTGDSSVLGIVLEAGLSKGEACSPHRERLGSQNRVFIDLTFRIQETPNCLNRILLLLIMPCT